jgi:hypothetical protein
MPGILRTSCYVDINGNCLLDLVHADDANNVECRRYVFRDAHQLLDAAEKMKLCGFDMLRHAPRPDPLERG